MDELASIMAGLIRHVPTLFDVTSEVQELQYGRIVYLDQRLPALSVAKKVLDHDRGAQLLAIRRHCVWDSPAGDLGKGAAFSTI